MSVKETGLNEATTLPASYYHDPHIYQLEREKIFSKTWQLFTHSSLISPPPSSSPGRGGEVMAGTIAEYPLVVIRDRDGELRGFHNVCRHRGGPLMWDGYCGKNDLIGTLIC